MLSTSPSWAITKDKTDLVVNKLIELAHRAKVILFGSFVNGTIHPNSDLDILVVTENEIDNPRKESARLRRGLRGISMPMDILVISQRRYQELSEVPGLIYHEISRQGQVIYDTSAPK